MALNQNETRGVGIRNSDCGIRNSRSRDAMHRAASPIRNPKPEIRNAFTLTELLVVITIIAVLAGLATNAAINALNAGKRTVITLELQQLATAVEQFKNDYGAYPPNGMSSGKNYGGNEVFNTIQSDFERMFTKAFPRSQEPKGLIRALAGNTSNNMPGMPSPLPGGMTSAEAVVFWLGGFSKDPQFPITGTGGPSFSGSDEVLESRNRSYEFDLGRLVPRNSTNQFDDSAGKGRFIEYTDPRNSIRRRINLWLYTPGGSQLPLAYFDTSRHDPDEYDPDLSGGTGAGIYAIKKLREGFDESATPRVSDIVYANTKKYQLLHPGLDDEWGDLSGFSIANATSVNDASAVSVFPTGPFIGDIADTLSNFTTGTLEAAQE